MKNNNDEGNLVIKLDMSKTYDRLSWDFLLAVMRRMGFSALVVNAITRLLSNNWYSVIINGTRYGFLNSTGGLKQGDPLSPSLFIIAAEALSKTLNRLNTRSNYISFSMNKRGPQINHLCYADDLILFTLRDKHSVKLMMDTLRSYQEVSGKKSTKRRPIFIPMATLVEGLLKE